MDEQWEWLTMREILRLLTVRTIWVKPTQKLVDLELENVLALEVKHSCSKKLMCTSMVDQKNWITFKNVLAPKMVNLESVSFCNFSNASEMDIVELNYLLEYWKFLELLEIPDYLSIKNINFKACRSLKKVILNGNYDSENLDCPNLPKWIQVIHD